MEVSLMKIILDDTTHTVEHRNRGAPKRMEVLYSIGLVEISKTKLAVGIV